MVAIRRHNSSDELLDKYWKEIKDIAPLSREEESELLLRAKNGDEAAHKKVLQSNLRFVVRVARQYDTPAGPPLIDLIAEGNMGMIEAIKRFDVERGFKFITYAVWWIRQAIFKALANQSRSVRPPMNQINDMYKIERRIAGLTQQLGRAPSWEEVAEEADISLERVRSAMEAGKWEVSLDEPLAEQGGETLMAMLPAEEAADDSISQEKLVHTLKAGLNNLDERESRIIHAYFGLGTTQPKTLEAIGSDLGITRERVRQLRNRALEKMRHACADLVMAAN
jgi:RNA polymerase primary sigma factor